MRSHQLAAKAAQEGFFDDEILPIDVEQADGSIMTVNKDQAVRGDTTLEALARLKPAFREGHQITAGKCLARQCRSLWNDSHVQGGRPRQRESSPWPS